MSTDSKCLHSKKLCIVGAEATHPLPVFHFGFSLLNHENPCLKLPQSEQARQRTISSPQRHWHGFSQLLSHWPVLVKQTHRSLLYILAQCHWSSDWFCSSSKTSLVSIGWVGLSSFKLTINRESRSEATGGTPLDGKMNI